MRNPQHIILNKITRSVSSQLVRDFYEIRSLEAMARLSIKKFIEAAESKYTEILADKISFALPEYTITTSQEIFDESPTVIINMLDGKENFIKGNPDFAYSLTSIDQDDERCTVIEVPMRNTTYIGSEGDRYGKSACYIDDAGNYWQIRSQIHDSSSVVLGINSCKQELVLSYLLETKAFNKLPSLKIRCTGCTCIDMLNIAHGIFDIIIYDDDSNIKIDAMILAQSSTYKLLRRTVDFKENEIKFMSDTSRAKALSSILISNYARP